MSWIYDLAPVFGEPIDLILDPSAEAAADYGSTLPPPKAFPVPGGTPADNEWKQNLASVLREKQWSVVLLNLLRIPPRSLRAEIDGHLLFDSAAFLYEVLRKAGDEQRVVALVPTGLLVDARCAPLRKSIGASKRLDWIVYLGREIATLLGAHPSYRFALIALGKLQKSDGSKSLIRLANLSEVPRADWRTELEAAGRREGGEGRNFIVLRDAQLDDRAWTYDRFSRQFSAMRRDASALGELKPLSTWIHDARIGLHRKQHAERFRELDDADRIPEGTIACFGGRSIRRDVELGSPVAAVDPLGVPPDLLLTSGDVLVRSILAPRANAPMVAAAAVAERDLPATFDHTCIRLRWSRDLDPRTREMIVAYLNSSHARDWLIAHGVQVALNVPTLKQLEIPDPSREVLEALAQLGEAEEQYRAWADTARRTRQELFSADSFARELPGLLGRHRIETERLRAARDVENLAYKIRNYYPYPVAARYIALEQLDHGDTRLERSLACAELTMQVLALMGFVQLAESHDPSKQIAGQQLVSFCRDGSLHLDWGKCAAVLEEAVSLTRAAKNPLSLPFPSLSELAEEIDDHESPWQKAQRTLKDQRNRHAHLERLPDWEIAELSVSIGELLEVLLAKASFVTTTPLVRVSDYSRDPVSDQRFASFDLLQGLSPAFERTRREVTAELARGAVGFLDDRGLFRPLAPWLMMEKCPRCNRPELFMFSRFDGKLSTYVAMETGHSQAKPELSERWASLIGTAEAGRD